MRPHQAETRQALKRRIILPLAGLSLVFVALMIACLYWIADFQNSMAIELQVKLARRAFAIEAENLAMDAAAYGNWDEAVTSSVKKQDREWMRVNVGEGVNQTNGIDFSFALDADGSPVYSYAKGRSGKTPPQQFFGNGFDLAYRTWKQGAPDNTYAGFVTYHDQAVGLAIAPVRSYFHPDQPATRFAIVFAKLIDAPKLHSIARDFQLANLQPVRTPADQKTPRASITVGQNSHTSMAAFTWDPRRPGDRLLEYLLPFFCAFLLLLAILAALVLNFVISSTRLLTEREHQASVDPLTSLANRKRFFAELDAALTVKTRDDFPPAVLYIDLDDFKAVNDGMGHAAGDELLLAAADRFLACVNGDDLVARLGGDEFAVLLRNGSDLSSCQAVAATILQAVSAPYRLQSGTAVIGCSIGGAIDNGSDDCAALLDRADKALYRVKADGKNSVYIAADRGRPHGSRLVA